MKSTVLHGSGKISNKYRDFCKRLFDIFVSSIFLIISFPFILPVWLMLCIEQKNNGLFFQERTGMNNKSFTIIKFKTMRDKIDDKGNLLPDYLRLTFFGKILRSCSFDEIPQLINVLKGDMSLVGPRPLLPEYLPLYNERQARRHEVRPGITGWAQVNGRNNLTWNEKFEMDIWYVDNVSFKLDMKILFMTLVKVIKREGINASDRETMKPFKGNE